MTKIDLITGILGAGKTTFLRRYAQYFIGCGQRIAILVNDFGAINVDMMMLRDLQSDLCRIEMIAGCGCADAHRRRFRTQLIALGMQHFDRVLVEPSGIFDMDEFFDLLYEQPLDRWFEIGSILTVISCEMQEKMPDEMEYLLASEAASSGRLILSKLPEGALASPDALAKRILDRLNGALAVISCDRRFSPCDLLIRDWDTLTAEDFAALSEAGYRKANYVKQFRTETMQSEVHYFMHVQIPGMRIPEVIESVLGDAECGNIFRIKGALPSEDGRYLKINATPEKTEILPVAEAQSVLIVIGDHVDRARIDTYLKAYNTDPAYVSI